VGKLEEPVFAIGDRVAFHDLAADFDVERITRLG